MMQLPDRIDVTYSCGTTRSVSVMMVLAQAEIAARKAKQFLLEQEIDALCLYLEKQRNEERGT